MSHDSGFSGKVGSGSDATSGANHLYASRAWAKGGEDTARLHDIYMPLDDAFGTNGNRWNGPIGQTRIQRTVSIELVNS